MWNPIVGVFVIGFYGCMLLRVTSGFVVLMLSSWRAQPGHGFNIGDTAIPQSPGVVFYARSCISGCKDKCIRTVTHPNVFRVRSVKIVDIGWSSLPKSASFITYRAREGVCVSVRVMESEGKRIYIYIYMCVCVRACVRVRARACACVRVRARVRVCVYIRASFFQLSGLSFAYCKAFKALSPARARVPSLAAAALRLLLAR